MGGPKESTRHSVASGRMEPLEEEVISAVEGGIFVVNSSSLAKYFEVPLDERMNHPAHKYWRDVLNRMNPIYHSGILISILNEGMAYTNMYTLMYAT